MALSANDFLTTPPYTPSARNAPVPVRLTAGMAKEDSAQKTPTYA